MSLEHAHRACPRIGLHSTYNRATPTRHGTAARLLGRPEDLRAAIELLVVHSVLEMRR